MAKDGSLWVCGSRDSGLLGEGRGGPVIGRRLPHKIDALHLGYAEIVSAACGSRHASAVTEYSTLYNWGEVEIPTASLLLNLLCEITKDLTFANI